MKSSFRRFSSLLLALLPCGAAHADFVSGQSADMILGGVRASGLLMAEDIAVDPATQKVFVADRSRHRVLRFSSQASLQNGGLAEAVFGAPDFFDQSAGTSATELSGPQGISVDAGGRLWVADTGNSRVLRFDNASTSASGSAASVVLGQPNFTSSTGVMQVNRLNQPADVEVDAEGRLWVADLGNRRVVRFDNAASRGNGVNADGVLGQASFTTYQTDINDSVIDSPRGLAVEISGGVTVRLWVTDWYRSRVMGWNNPGSKPNGAPASKLLGQTDFAAASTGAIGQNRLNRPYKLAMENGGLWVADTDNYRVLHFAAAGNKPLGGNADLVLGQLDFNARTLDASTNILNLPVALAASGGRLWIGDGAARVVRHDNAASKGNGTDPEGVLGRNSLAAGALMSTTEVVIDSVSGKMFVADSSANRVLRYPAAVTLTETSVPEAVLGQPDFTTFSSGTTASKMNGPGALAVDALGNLWVADTRNHRVLRFANAASAATGSAAAQVLGQSNFTSGTSSVSASRFNSPSGLATEWGLTGNFQTVVRRLWVADTSNNRVLRFDSPLTLGDGAAASGVLGAANITAAGTGNTVVSASSLYWPGSLAVDFNGRLWVADTGHDRVLRFDSAAAKANNANADGVLLQANFTTTTASSAATVTGLCLGGSLVNRLYVTRLEQKDIIWFDNAPAKTGTVAHDGFLGGTAIYAEPGDTSAALAPDGRLWVGKYGAVMRFSPAIASRITGFGFNAQNRFFLNILGTGGETYQIRSSTDLQNWSTIEATQTVPGTTTQSMTWTAPSAPTGPKKFYRLQAQ